MAKKVDFKELNLDDENQNILEDREPDLKSKPRRPEEEKLTA